MMKYRVVLTDDAAHDLEDIYEYIASNDSEIRANQVLDAIQETAEGLNSCPERGAYVTELKVLGMTEFRQTYFKPYRIIYRVMDEQVVIYLITDGRRDMQTLLSRRLLLR